MFIRQYILISKPSTWLTSQHCPWSLSHLHLIRGRDEISIDLSWLVRDDLTWRVNSVVHSDSIEIEKLRCSGFCKIWFICIQKRSRSITDYFTLGIKYGTSISSIDELDSGTIVVALKNKKLEWLNLVAYVHTEKIQKASENCNFHTKKIPQQGLHWKAGEWWWVGVVKCEVSCDRNWVEL